MSARETVAATISIYFHGFPELDLHPNILSIVWVVISCIALCYSLRALRTFQRAVRVANDSDFNGNRKQVAILLAKDYFHGEALRLTQHLLSIIIGVQSMFIPPLPRTTTLDRTHVIYSFEVALVLIFINLLASANSIRSVYSWNHREEVIHDSHIPTVGDRLDLLRRSRQARKAAQDTKQIAKDARQIAEDAAEVSEKLEEIGQ